MTWIRLRQRGWSLVVSGQALVALVAEDQCLFACFEHDRIFDRITLDDLLGQPHSSGITDGNDLEFDGFRAFHWRGGLGFGRNYCTYAKPRCQLPSRKID